MKTIIRNSIFMGLFNIFGRGSGFIRYLLLVGFLSTNDYGLITFAFSFGEIGRHFMDGGLDNLISRDGARDYSKIPNYGLHGLVIKAFLGLLFSVGSWFYLTLYRDLSPYETLVVYAALSGSVLLSLTGVLRSCFTAVERMEYVFYTNLPVRLISLFALFLSLWLSLPVVYAAGAVSLENFLWFGLLGVYGLRSFLFKGVRFSLSFIKYMLLESWPLALYGFFNILYMNLDVVMIESIMGGREYVGSYTYASFFIKGISMLLSGYMIAIYPALSRYHTTNESAYRSLFRQSVLVLMSMTLPISALLFFWADGWMNFIRETDAITGQILQVLALTMNISVLNTLIIIVFTSRDRQHWLVGFTAIAVVLSFVSNWIMIVYYAQVGAAVASLVSQIVLLLIMAFFMFRLFGIRFPVWKPLQIGLAAGGVGWMTWLLPGIPLLLVPFVFGVFLLLSVWMFRILTPEELRGLWVAVREK